MNIAFAGFRHYHIMTLYEMAEKNPDTNIVACYEANEDARNKAVSTHNVNFTHATYEDVLNDKNVEVVAIGDYYSIRGQMVIQALKAGKHVICDKPICTDLKELDEIERLHKETGLVVMCMLDLRYAHYSEKAKELIESGKIGKLTIGAFTAQHCLAYGTRPGWYFEEGCHGGTINDIAIHGVDLFRYMTGKELSKINYAKTWNLYADKHPHFKDCGQFVAEMGDFTISADVSYASPACNVTLPTYWEFTIWGLKGMMRFNYAEKIIRIYTDKEEIIELDAVEAPLIENLMDEIKGIKTRLNTDDILKSQRQVLEIQKFADDNA